VWQARGDFRVACSRGERGGEGRRALLVLRGAVILSAVTAPLPAAAGWPLRTCNALWLLHVAPDPACALGGLGGPQKGGGAVGWRPGGLPREPSGGCNAGASPMCHQAQTEVPLSPG
jgi:hypothetical protein